MEIDVSEMDLDVGYCFRKLAVCPTFTSPSDPWLIHIEDGQTNVPDLFQRGQCFGTWYVSTCTCLHRLTHNVVETEFEQSWRADKEGELITEAQIWAQTIGRSPKTLPRDKNSESRLHKDRMYRGLPLNLEIGGSYRIYCSFVLTVVFSSPWPPLYSPGLPVQLRQTAAISEWRVLLRFLFRD